MARAERWDSKLIEPCRDCGQREGLRVYGVQGYLCRVCHQDSINYAAAEGEITEALRPILNELLDIWENNSTMRRDRASLNELFTEALTRIGAQILLERAAGKPRRR